MPLQHILEWDWYSATLVLFISYNTISLTEFDWKTFRFPESPYKSGQLQLTRVDFKTGI